MKWTIELNDKLKELVLSEKNVKEISKDLNISIRGIQSRMFRLGLKIIKQHHEIILCKNCGNEINKTLSNEKIFCDHVCSAQYNNKFRKHSDETKNKIRNKLLELGKLKSPKEKTLKQINKKEIKYRICKNCGKEIFQIRKTYCDECRINYYSIYRPSCEFTFNIDDYKSVLDFNLLNEYGKYSPSNKGNNLNGISRDHMYSVKDGFINSVDYNIIKHPANCKLMKHTDNNKKKTNSSITLDELNERIRNWNSIL